MSDAGSTVKKLFINDEQELRCLWRVLAFALVLQIAFLVIGGLVGVLALLIPALRNLLDNAQDAESRGWSFFFSYTLIQVVSLAAALLANAVCARYLEHRTFASTGFKFHKGWGRDLLLGSLLGAATVALAIGIAAAGGTTALRDNAATEGGFLLPAFLALLVFFVISAANEEAMVRGFAFQAIEHNLGAVPAVAISSVVFALLHLLNPNVTLFSTLNTMLAGVWLGVAYLMTRSLWLATALHFAWNLVMVFVFGLPVSGIRDFQNFTWLTGESTVRWVSGADYGPEGGVAATVALVVSTVVIWKSKLFKATEEMRLAIQHGKPELDTPLSIVAERDE